MHSTEPVYNAVLGIYIIGASAFEERLIKGHPVLPEVSHYEIQVIGGFISIVAERIRRFLQMEEATNEGKKGVRV